MMSQIPFNKPLYLKVLPVVFIGILFVFVLAVVCFGYELTLSDPFGAPIAATLLAYIIHLGLWNPSSSE